MNRTSSPPFGIRVPSPRPRRASEAPVSSSRPHLAARGYRAKAASIRVPGFADIGGIDARALGITRVARVTGLDRAGVEVACAVRPRGHVLQVCNGKGERFEQASLGAVLEAAELWAAERVDPLELVFGSLDELQAAGAEAWDAACLGSGGPLVAPRLWSRKTRLAWRAGQDLVSGQTVFVPACALHCPPAGAPPLGPAVVRWTSNGCGAHPDRSRALAHALFEAAERDQLARALPDGWTAEAVRERMLSTQWLHRHAPAAAAWCERLAARGFDAFLFDLAPHREDGGLGVPVAGALLFDLQPGAPVPLTAGYACAPDAGIALLGALLEAAQSRLTDIHGARDDVSPADPADAQRLHRACAKVKPARRGAPLGLTARHRGPSGAVAALLDRMAARGAARAAAFDVAPETAGVHVVRVIVPGFELTELL